MHWLPGIGGAGGATNGEHAAVKQLLSLSIVSWYNFLRQHALQLSGPVETHWLPTGVGGGGGGDTHPFSQVQICPTTAPVNFGSLMVVTSIGSTLVQDPSASSQVPLLYVIPLDAFPVIASPCSPPMYTVPKDDSAKTLTLVLT